MCSEHKRHTMFLRLGTHKKKKTKREQNISDHSSNLLFILDLIKQFLKLVLPATGNFKITYISHINFYRTVLL